MYLLIAKAISFVGGHMMMMMMIDSISHYSRLIPGEHFLQKALLHRQMRNIMLRAGSSSRIICIFIWSGPSSRSFIKTLSQMKLSQDDMYEQVTAIW